MLPFIMLALSALPLAMGQEAPSATTPLEAPPESEAQPAPDFEPTSVNLGLGGLVPASAVYRPLTLHERGEYWFNTNFVSPRVYIRAIALTIPEHTANSPEAWGTGWDGYGKRVAARFGRFAISSSIEHAGNAALGHDPRYISCRDCKSKISRVGHAFKYTFLTFNRHGKPVLNVSHIAGQVGSEFIAAKWVPGRTWRHELAPGVLEQVSLGWVSNIAREFAPELKRALTRKRKPAKP